MLKLSHITKQYQLGDNTIDALRGIDLEFRENEFVSILGPSGCGKTTTLNIIGGLDRYTDGDLIINGRSTREYKDSDWDAYRNHSIGFVFQSYNLISHQTVLANVELALTLAGVSRTERRRRAIDALERVGLGDQLDKLPSQMSGGQMQRVAIARALINDPDILLADEPTGALDSETSVQVMELLKEVARDRLVIMVTHNPELAEEYSTRIVKLKDGLVIDDSDPYHSEEAPLLTGKEARTGKKPSMSFLTALSLSLTNLRTKMGRTVLTAFAGSIGIIGIALILALSTGINNYINKVQEDTLSSYPITIQAETTDMSSLLAGFMEAREDAWSGERDPDRVYSSTVMFDMMNSMVNAQTQTNNLEAFRAYLESGGGGIKDIAHIDYDYDFDFDFYTTDEDEVILKCDVMSLMESAMGSMFGGDYSSYFSSSMGSMYSSMDVWSELLAGEDGELISQQTRDQYELLYGRWPESYDEVVLFVSPSNEISDLMLYALGLMPADDMEQVMTDMMNGQEVETDKRSWSYEELAGISFKLILPAEYWQYDAATGGYTDMSATDAGMDYLYNSDDVGLRLKVAGVARALPDTNGRTSGSIGYTSALTAWAIKTTGDMEIVQKQLDDPDTDVFSALPFPTEDDVEPTDAEKGAAIADYLSGLSTLEKAEAYIDVMSQPSREYVDGIVDQQMAGMTRESIEEMILEQYASEMGVDEDTIRSYIADMSDEELFGRVREAIEAAVADQYAAAVSQQLSALPTDQLAALLDEALAQVGNGEEADAGDSAGSDDEGVTATALAAARSEAGRVVALNAASTATTAVRTLSAPMPAEPSASVEPTSAPEPTQPAGSPDPEPAPAPDTTPAPSETLPPEESEAPSESLPPEESAEPTESLPPEESEAPGASPEPSAPAVQLPEGWDAWGMAEWMAWFQQSGMSMEEAFAVLPPEAQARLAQLFPFPPVSSDPGTSEQPSASPEPGASQGPAESAPPTATPSQQPGASSGQLPAGWQSWGASQWMAWFQGSGMSMQQAYASLPPAAQARVAQLFGQAQTPGASSPLPGGSDTPAIPGIPGISGGLPEDIPGLSGETGETPQASSFEDWQLVYLYDNYMPPTISDSTYEENLDRLAYVRQESPSTISIYAATFAEKDEIADLIAEYNEGVSEDDQITYTDYVALLMSSITDIISGISYLLIAFVSISLIVSSIMIGIITNISVLERTKEIGILRAVGASKRDVSRVFNAETFIVGLGAGLLGILVSALATIPINAVIHSLTDLEGLNAVLPPAGAVVLVCISMVLTVVAGLIPARSAARKDPVEALRSE